MKITYVICFIAISSLCLEVSTQSNRNVLNALIDTIRSLFNANAGSTNFIKANEGSTNDEFSCGVPSSNTVMDRIVGGELAEPDEFPWIVSIQLKLRNKTFHTCGGAVVHPLFILTAGHCTNKIDEKIMIIFAGKHELYIHEEHEQSRSVVKVIATIYNPKNFENDIALLKLNKPLEIDSKYIVPGCLPTMNEKFKGYAIVAGWGMLKENGEIPKILRKVTLPLFDSKNCTTIYKGKGYRPYMHKCEICTLADDEKDACQGDSGGPLMCMDETSKKLCICGIVSWGQGCARSGTPGVYTEVSCHVDWIYSNIKANLQ